MKREPVTSSHVVSIGYEPGAVGSAGTLEVEFAGGGVYQYLGVPQHEYDALKNADSVGKHLHRHIRGRYTHKRL